MVLGIIGVSVGGAAVSVGAAALGIVSSDFIVPIGGTMVGLGSAAVIAGIVGLSHGIPKVPRKAGGDFTLTVHVGVSTIALEARF